MLDRLEVIILGLFLLAEIQLCEGKKHSGVVIAVFERKDIPSRGTTTGQLQTTTTRHLLQKQQHTRLILLLLQSLLLQSLLELS